jgi:GR25 family glycosyltransferase involved in LPS biosynthesis
MKINGIFMALLFSLAGQISAKSIYKAYVINIPSRKARLESITKQLNGYGIPFEVQRGITPADLKAESEAKRLKQPPTGLFDPETKLDFTFISPTKLRPTEIGCAQGHIQALLKIASNRTSDPVLVIEDDASLVPNFYNRTVDIMRRLPASWDIFHVGYCFEARCLGPHSEDFCRIRRGVLWCTQAYFVNGSKAAKLILNTINTEIPRVIDINMYRSTFNYYASLPKLAKQIYAFGSDNGNPMIHWKDSK